MCAGVQATLEQQLEAAQQTPPRVREAEDSLRGEQERIEALLRENIALSQRAQQLQQQAAAVQDPPLPGPPVRPPLPQKGCTVCFPTLQSVVPSWCKRRKLLHGVLTITCRHFSFPLVLMWWLIEMGTTCVMEFAGVACAVSLYCAAADKGCGLSPGFCRASGAGDGCGAGLPGGALAGSEAPL